jgi:hypothetical protein
MTPRAINRAALVVVLPAVLVGGLLTLAFVTAVVGLPLLALTVPALVLALVGGISAGAPAEVKPALPWLLGGLALLLLGGVAAVAAFGGNDLDQPEELVIGAGFALWGVGTAYLAFRARGAAGQPTSNRRATGSAADQVSVAHQPGWS